MSQVCFGSSKLETIEGREAACNCLHSQTGEVHRQPVLSVDVQISGD